MVKGISRQVIVVHSPDPKLFEQAIFILSCGKRYCYGRDFNERSKTTHRIPAEQRKGEILFRRSRMGMLWRNGHRFCVADYLAVLTCEKNRNMV